MAQIPAHNKITPDFYSVARRPGIGPKRNQSPAADPLWQTF